MTADLLDLIAGRAIELGLPWGRSREWNICECRDGQHHEWDLDGGWNRDEDHVRGVLTRPCYGDHAHVVSRQTVSASTRAQVTS